MVVNPSFPARTVPELIAYAKANPRKINFASGGAGGPDHMAAEYFKLVTGTEMLHVPYRGLGPALTDLIGGQVQLIFATMPAAIEYIKADRLRALAVTTSARSEALPDVPMVADSLPGFEASQWYALGAAKNTPADVVATINKEVLAGLADPKVRARIDQLGGVPMPMSPGRVRQVRRRRNREMGEGGQVLRCHAGVIRSAVRADRRASASRRIATRNRRY